MSESPENFVNMTKNEDETSVPKAPFIEYGGEKEAMILLRYDHVYRALVHSGWDISGSIEKDSLVDWSLAYAMEGHDYFVRLHKHINHANLRNAIFLVTTTMAYCNPPVFNDELLGNYFKTLAGIAAVANISCIISYSIFSICCDYPIGKMDAMVSRVKNHTIYIFGMFFECKAILSLLAATLLGRTFSSERTSLLITGVLLTIIITAWTWTLIYTDEIQDNKVRIFYRKYIDKETGALSAAALKRIYQPESLAEFLQAISLSHHLDKLQDFPLADVLLMDKTDLLDILQVNAGGASKNNNNASAEQRAARQLLMSEVRTILEEIQRVKYLPCRTDDII